MKKLLLIILLFPTVLFSQIPKPQPNTYINDLAGVLTASQVSDLNKQIHSIEVKYSVQIAVVLVNEIPENTVIEDYAREIGRTWHVGNAKNGLVYVAAIKQHKQRLEVAQNLEGTITDATAHEITDHIKTYFRNSDYAGGINNMLTEIDKNLNPVKEEQQALATAEKVKKDQQRGDLSWLWWLFGALGLTGLTIYLFRKKKEPEKEYTPYKPAPAPRVKAASWSAGMTNEEIQRENRRRYGNTYYEQPSSPVYVAPIIPDYGSSGSSYSSGSSSSSSSSNDSSSSSSDYGNWGSGSSDSSSSSDSGFSGGGSSNDW